MTTLMIRRILVFLLLTNLTLVEGSRNPRRRHAIPYAPYCKQDVDIIADDMRLHQVLHAAEFVFSGKVTDVHLSSSNSTIIFGVLVKRHFKHPRTIEGVSIVRIAKRLRESEFGKCRQVVRERYTAIFVGSKPEVKSSTERDDEPIFNDVDVVLDISPVPITLGNLDRVNAATKDVAYRPKQTYVEEPCDKTFCAWGAQCVTGSDGRALCQCLLHCRPHVEPVCGSDGRTYENHCQLRVASCRARLNTRVIHAGKCEKNDPCKNKQCKYGAKCLPSSDGREASCQCLDKCSTDEIKTETGSVCGSDAIDYSSECELQRVACTNATNTTVMFLGKCDPCSGVKCTEPEICQLDENRNTVCRCGDICPLEFTPVCGSDGKTYSNECTLRQEACRTRKTLNIIYRGKCSSGVNPCTSVQCRLGEECAINKFGIARCECPPACELILRPVCSKEGRTYSSECELKRAVCLGQQHVEIAHFGICGKGGPCNNYRCYHGATCVERSGEPHCECSTHCPAEFEPVCGSDGTSYGNECKLRREACLQQKEITILYKNPCNGCETKNCDFYAVCESDEDGSEGRCVCPQLCGEDKLINGTVCGTDGITYPNECDLRLAACKSSLYVITAYKGDCDLCLNVECKNGARCEAGECVCPTNCDPSDVEPVCASNMQTYSNECELQKAACVPGLKPPLTVAFYGDCMERFPVGSPGAAQTTLTPPMGTQINTLQEGDTMPTEVTPSDLDACKDIHCDFEATCELGMDNFPRCSCQFDCANSDTKAVCASDLRIYPSLCAMKMAACEKQEELRLRPLDLCQGMEVKPCNGGKPIVDLVDGKELDCGHGPQRKDCPAGSYCHQTTQFARCCSKDLGALQKRCEDSWFGCCPDGKNAAQGPDHAGCPALCGCNKLGSYAEICDPETQQCRCRPGVGGEKCDRCEPGYWGLPKISSGHHGCIPCGCSTFGSVRDDCEQMTGRCVCKPGVQGQKCALCANHNKALGPNGCVSSDLSPLPAESCKNLTCHFGATCIERGRYAMCDCPVADCSEEVNPQIVCGSDGQTYPSACQLRQVACKFQKDIVVQAFGTCKEDSFPGTVWPLRKYTPLQFTQSDDSNSPLSKSTRHLMVPDPRYYYERRGSLPKNTLEASFTIESDYGIRDNMSDLGPSFNLSGESAVKPTSATVRVVTALLGDLCSDNEDCIIAHSECHGGACICLESYFESPDRQDCIDTSNLLEYHACTSGPCQNGAKCVDLPSATFTCICRPNYTGLLCESELEIHKQYDTPAFDGHSYVRLKPLKAYHKLAIEVEFKTHSKNGIILYNQQNIDGHGDFVSIAIVNGYVEFRYNLGDGMVVITSLDKVQINHYHRVIAKRYHRDGMLQLDDGENIAGQSKGTLRALDLVEDTFIGYVPSNYTRINDNIGTTYGFQGCIRKLKIGRHEVELQEQRDDWVVSVKGIHECGENACASLPCQNGGQCRTISRKDFHCECGTNFGGRLCEDILDPCISNPCNDGECNIIAGSFFCKCPLNRMGPNCQFANIETRDLIPNFNSTSFLQFPKLEGVSRTFTIEVSFLTRVSNGLIFYNGQKQNGRGDFISLAIVRGHLQFRFNLGSGIANITSNEIVSLGKWHWARIYRDGRDGYLQLDNSTYVRGHSGAPLTELNLEMPFYIGSVVNWQEVHRLAGISKGFNGAIRRLMLNGLPLGILDQKIPECSFTPVNASGCSFAIGRYDGPPCSSKGNPCFNNGRCLPNGDDYICQCQVPYEGQNCEIFKENAVKFSGFTFLHFKNRGYKSYNSTNTIEEYELDQEINNYDELNQYGDYNDEDLDTNPEIFGRKGERGNRYEFKLRTTAQNGLLLWRSKSRSLQEDYLSVAIVDGYPELSYNLGRQKHHWAIRAKSRVDDGNWHTIRVRRRKRVGFIAVDDEIPTKGVAESGPQTLNTNSKLWIGGSHNLPDGLPTEYYTGFVGCVQHLHVHARTLDLNQHSDAAVKSVEFCNDNDVR